MAKNENIKDYFKIIIEDINKLYITKNIDILRDLTLKDLNIEIVKYFDILNLIKYIY